MVSTRYGWSVTFEEGGEKGEGQKEKEPDKKGVWVPGQGLEQAL